MLFVEVVLLLTLFSDGLLVERDLLRQHWHPAARALVIAMPINATLLALVAKAVFSELSWMECFLVGFALSPTDPVVTSSVVASVRVPARVRHTLNLESGLNDGLALPFVLFLLAFAGEDQAGSAVASAGELAVESVLGVAVGGALAPAAGGLIGRLPAWALAERYEGLYALGLGLASFGVADLAHGNGLISAFVCGVVFAVVRHEIPDVFHHFNESLSSVLQIVAFRCSARSSWPRAGSMACGRWWASSPSRCSSPGRRPCSSPSPGCSLPARSGCSSRGSARRASRRCSSPCSS